MVPLGKFLVARLHRRQRGWPCQPESRQRFLELRRRLLIATGAGPTPDPAACEQMQRVTQQFLIPRGTEAAEWPAWPLPGGVGAKLRLDLARAHPFVIIPRRV